MRKEVKVEALLPSLSVHGYHSSGNDYILLQLQLLPDRSAPQNQFSLGSDYNVSSCNFRPRGDNSFP